MNHQIQLSIDESLSSDKSVSLQFQLKQIKTEDFFDRVSLPFEVILFDFSTGYIHVFVLHLIFAISFSLKTSADEQRLLRCCLHQAFPVFPLFPRYLPL